MNHSQIAHQAYENLANALDEYVKAYTREDSAHASDWMLIASVESSTPMQVGYVMPTSFGPPHVFPGLIDEATSILQEDQFDRRAHERGECTCPED